MKFGQWLAAISIGLWSPMSLHGQVPQKIVGQVIDADGKGIAGADVATRWQEDNGKMQPSNGVQTDKEGRFSLPLQSGFGHAVLALDKERKTGGLVIFDGKSPSLKIEVQPLVKVHGSLLCKELNNRPDWTFMSVYALTKPTAFSQVVIESTPKNGAFSFLLPPGRYSLKTFGTGVQDVGRELILSSDKPDLDLKTLDMPATIIARHVGKALPRWQVTDARGAKKEVQLSNYKGKWVLVMFWQAGNSGGMPGLIDLYETRKKDRDKFEIIVFHDSTVKDFKELDERLKTVKETFWRGRDLPFPLLLDSTGQTFKNYGISRFPTTILIDPEGKLVGEAHEEQLEDKLPQLPMAARVSNALDKSLSFYFDDPPLEKAVKELSDLAKIPIRLDKDKLKEVGIASDAKIPIKINVQNGYISLRSALNLVLDAYELGYRQDEKGLLVEPRKIGTSRSDNLSEPQRAGAKRIQKLLDQKITFSLQNKSLDQVATFLSMRTREIFVLEPADRRAGLLDPKALVHGSVTDVPLREALEGMLAPGRVRFEVRDEAVVLTFKARVGSSN